MPHIIPPAAIAIIAIAVWALALSPKAFGAFADDRAGRLASLDGLRGILALLVFAHHFAITRQYQLTGAWALTPARSWNLFGQVGVALFFMITGYLFADKLRRAGGRIEAGRFLLGRLCRLAPVYLATMALVAIVICLSGSADLTGGVLAQEIGHWLTFDAGPLLGFADAGRMVAFVPWSLRYEWVFYALVPVIGIAWAALGLRAWPVYAVSAMTLVLAVLPRDIPVLQINSMFLAPFALGGCAATIDRQSRLADILRGGWGVALVLLALALVFRTQVTAYAPVPFLLLACVFLPIALGNSVFGLLSSRPLQILGAISYDVYLVHGLVLYVAYTLLLPSALGDAGMLSSLVQLIVLGFVVIAVSIGLHRLVERPGERLGAYLARSGLRERLAAP